MYNSKQINSKEFSQANSLLRKFFDSKGFIEVSTQCRLSILSACEDPSTISEFNYSGESWPLKQTGQMDLEYELLTNKDYQGVYCQSTSYRQEANPIPGRHDLIFPMFEFESRGSMSDLINLEVELLEFLGIEPENRVELKESSIIETVGKYYASDYTKIADYFGVKDISANEEDRINKIFSSVLFLKNFPEYTSPFWNMKRSEDEITSNKVDVILYGIETIGSAEREIDSNIMLNRFHSISDGKYSETLYARFGRARVMRELGAFLDLEMVPRFGAGIGMTRLIRALKFAGIIKAEN